MFRLNLGYPGYKFAWMETMDKSLWERDYLTYGTLPKTPIEFKVMNSSRLLKDGTGSTGSSKIVSQRFKDLCDQNEIQGLSYIPIVIKDQAKLSNQDQYYIIRPIVNGPSLQKGRTRFIPCGSPNPAVIDRFGWTIEWPSENVDIFRPGDSGLLVINHRFRKILIDEMPKLEGVNVFPLSGLSCF